MRAGLLADTLHIACVTTSRADYGLLKWPMRAMRDDPDTRLSVIAGGGHLSAAQGETASEIEADGFRIAERVPIYAEGADAPAQGAARATAGVATALQRLRPDWVMLLGDRFEILGAATAAMLARVPICHLCGGDITEGAYDDAIRHAVSKLSHLHCPSTEDSAARLRQMGEEPWRVHVTGSPGLDAIHAIERLERHLVTARLGIPEGRPYYLVTMHPETHRDDYGIAELDALLQVLGAQTDASVVLTGVNADSGGTVFQQRIAAFLATHDHAVLHLSLGQMLYLNAVSHARGVVGNSSSGLYEAPSFGVPTVNIGSRQDGRLRAISVFDCDGTVAAIEQTLAQANDFGHQTVQNPYGDGHSAARILTAIRQTATTQGRETILKKRFVPLAPETTA
jgi:UDP-hydrolysing UDP-N-acetyl-D-glucosamine 2-epimerase